MPKKKRSTFGSVTRLDKNRWRLRWWADGPDGRKRRTEIVRGTRREADDRLAEIRLGVGSVPGGCETVGGIWESRVLPQMGRELRARTLKNTKCVWQKWLEPRWAAVPASKVRASDFQDWVLGLSHETAKRCTTIMREVMRHAVMLEEIAVSPLAIKIELPTTKTKSFSREVVAAPDMEDYWECVRGTFLEPMFLLAACGGLRVGESLGVMVGEVEREESEGSVFAAVQVRRQIDPRGLVVVEDVGNGDEEMLKNEQSTRWAVAFDPWATRLLEAQDSAAKRGDVWLCDDGTGSPIGSDAARRQWHRMTAAAGLARIDLRNLRATFATQARSEHDLRVEDVARLMGHKKPAITYSVYQRPGKEELIKAVSHAL